MLCLEQPFAKDCHCCSNKPFILRSTLVVMVARHQGTPVAPIDVPKRAAIKQGGLDLKVLVWSDKCGGQSTYVWGTNYV